jgi:hypothetical protein
MPIKARVDMLTAGIRTPIGTKSVWPRSCPIARVGESLEKILRDVPRTRAVYAEREMGGFYVDFVPDRTDTGNKEEEKMKRVTVVLAVGLLLLAVAVLPAIRAGAQPTTVTDDNLDQMITSAKTPAEHEAIAAYFEQEAKEAKKKAELHRRSADTYRKMKVSKPVYMAEMCDNVAAYWDGVSTNAENLAKAHRAMAKTAGAKSGE